MPQPREHPRTESPSRYVPVPHCCHHQPRNLPQARAAPAAPLPGKVTQSCTEPPRGFLAAPRQLSRAGLSSNNLPVTNWAWPAGIAPSDGAERLQHHPEKHSPLGCLQQKWTGKVPPAPNQPGQDHPTQACERQPRPTPTPPWVSYDPKPSVSSSPKAPCPSRWGNRSPARDGAHGAGKPCEGWRINFPLAPLTPASGSSSIPAPGASPFRFALGLCCFLHIQQEQDLAASLL